MKKILSVLITSAMLISILTCFCFTSSIMDIVTQPTVFLCGNQYNIIWTSTKNVDSIGYVEYTYSGKNYLIYDEENGVIRSGDYIHTVSVPVEHLDGAGAYKVTSVKVNSRSGNTFSYGESISTGTIEFRGYNKDDDEINIFAISDTHLTNTAQRQMVLDSVSHLKGTPDIIAMCGDFTNTLNYKDNLPDHILPLIAAVSSSSIPVLFVRGNHENHGAWAGDLSKYLLSDEGEMYFTFQYGPLAGIVLNYGEDKDDTNSIFKGVVDYTTEYAKQVEWLEGLGGYGDDNTQYRMVFCHGADIISHYGYNLIEPLDAYGTDLMVSGHHHTLKLFYPAGFTGSGDPDLDQKGTWNSSGYSTSYCSDFPILIDGSHVNNKTFNTSQIILKDGNISIYGITEKSNGVYTDTINCSFKAGKNVIDNTYTARGTDYYYKNALNTTDDSFVDYFQGYNSYSKDTSDIFGFTSKPTVFDTGDTYTVAWSTTEGTAATGEVYVEYCGKILRFTDMGSGPMRIMDNTSEWPGFENGKKNLHSVEIPKKYLEKGRYKVISRHVVNSEYLTFIKGSTAETDYINFVGYSDQSDINMLVCSDISGSDTFANKIKALEANYDILVLNGNSMENVNNASDIAKMLSVTGSMTSGAKPVVFVRGRNDISGKYAAYLSEIISNSTGEFYNKISYGPMTAIVFDALNVTTSLTAKQKAWYSEQDYGDATYKLVLSDTDYGVDYAINADLVVTGDTGASKFSTANGYRIATNGQSDGTVATLITMSGNTISVTALSQNKDVIMSHLLQISPSDTAELDKAVNEAKSYSNFDNKYCENTFEALQTAIINAQELTRYSLQSDIDKAVLNIKNAISGLKTHSFEIYIFNNDATCIADGTKTATCTTDGCTQTHTRTAEGSATGRHTFTEYKYNNDSTYKTDGTETAKCNTCDKKDTRTAQGTKLPLTDSLKIYTDIKADAWYKESIDYAATFGIMNGVSSTEMKPNSNVTRAQFVQILANLEGIYTQNRDVTTMFTDVKSGQWFSPAIKWASENDIVDGLGNNKFNPNGNLTREQMCKMIIGYVSYKSISLKKTTDKVTFADDASISMWAHEYVYECQTAGLVQGISNDFKPKNLASRAQIATIMMRFDKAYDIVK